MPPFQGLELVCSATQGVALGYGSLPRWGVESDGVAVDAPILPRPNASIKDHSMGYLAIAMHSSVHRLGRLERLHGLGLKRERWEEVEREQKKQEITIRRNRKG